VCHNSQGQKSPGTCGEALCNTVVFCSEVTGDLFHTVQVMLKFMALAAHAQLCQRICRERSDRSVQGNATDRASNLGLNLSAKDD
jgi:hypothetical protein